MRHRDQSRLHGLISIALKLNFQPCAKETEMSTTQIVSQDKDTAIRGELYMSFELGDKSWKLTASDGRRGPSRFSVHAGDTAAVLDCVRRARERRQLEPQGPVHSGYEADV
jgi:transposase